MEDHTPNGEGRNIIQNPLNERLEAIESDINNIKKSINDLSNQLFNQNSRFLNDERFCAKLQLSHNLLWALWILNPAQNNPNTQFDAGECIRYARETAASALTEINYTSTPYETASKWYYDCAKHFKDNNFPKIF